MVKRNAGKKLFALVLSLPCWQNSDMIEERLFTLEGNCTTILYGKENWPQVTKLFQYSCTCTSHHQTATMHARISEFVMYGVNCTVLRKSTTYFGSDLNHPPYTWLARFQTWHAFSNSRRQQYSKVIYANSSRYFRHMRFNIYHFTFWRRFTSWASIMVRLECSGNETEKQAPRIPKPWNVYAPRLC